MKRFAILGLGMAFLATSACFAGDDSQANQYAVSLTSVATAELPARTAALVKEAPAKEREAATVTIVRTAVKLNPAAAPAIVGAVARSVPEMAAVAAGTAATVQPKQ